MIIQSWTNKLEFDGGRVRWASAAQTCAKGPSALWNPNGRTSLNRRTNSFPPVWLGCQASSRAKRTKGKSLKNELVHFSGIFPLFSGALCAPRGQRSWPCPGTVAGVKACWRQIPQHLRRQTQPSSVPSWAPRRNAPRSSPSPAKSQFAALSPLIPPRAAAGRPAPAPGRSSARPGA